MKQFAAFIRKEFYHVFRDRKTLLLLFGMPIVQILLFGFALSNEIKNSKVIVCDLANDGATSRIVAGIGASKYFGVEKVTHRFDDVDASFKAGTAKLAVVFPANFSRDLRHGDRASVQVISDASDPNTAVTITNYVSQIIGDYTGEQNANAQVPMQIQPVVRMIYNPELKGATNFVPGVMALVLMIVSVLMTSVSIVREKENGTMEVLLASPVNPLLVNISKAVPYFLLSLVNLTVILVLSVTVLGLPIKGSVFLVFAESALIIVTALSLGLLISNITSSQQAAMLISLFAMLLPTVLLTGFMFPVENMPLVLRLLSNVVPAKWYYIIIKNVMIKGLGFAAVWKETLVLVGMTLLLLFLSLKNFKRRLQ